MARKLGQILAIGVILMAPSQLFATEPGSWCVAALEKLQGDGLTRDEMASRLLAHVDRVPSAPAVEPRRRVFVSADAAGTADGTEKHPYPSIQMAVDSAAPGDTILVAPGRYMPVVITRSGTTEAPITLSGIDDGTGRRPLIDGTGTDVRGLIAIRGASHITVSGFRLQNAPRDGIFVEGSDAGERGIRIRDNDIAITGNSGIYVGGIVMRHTTKVDEYRLFDVVIEGNRVTRTNEPDGRNEAITLGGGVDGFIIRNNHVFDTQQYGIDVKAGAINGIVSDNVIHGVERHGIYLDAGSRRVAHILVTRNAIFATRNGIVMARESNRDPAHPNMHNIRVTDNLIFDTEKFGINAYRHVHDSGQGRFEAVTIAQNCMCRTGSDGIRLGGIGSFAKDFAVRDNLILGSRGRIGNNIGAVESGNTAFAQGLACPDIVTPVR